MPPKKAAKAKGPAGADEVDVNKQLRDNYGKACKVLGIDVCEAVTKALTVDEEATIPYVTQFVSEAELGSATVRALCAAILGRGSTMKGDPYAPLKSMRFWRSKVGDSGVAAVAEVLKLGRDKVQLTHLEFMDCDFGPPGCRALGDALMMGANKSLLTLRLDNNPFIAGEGIMDLCLGLRTNKTLKKLTASYCSIGPEGAAALGDVLANPDCALGHLDLMGNRVGSEGLQSIAQALLGNTVLKELVLCDNTIGASADAAVNKQALTTLGDVLLSERAALCRIDMSMNALEAGDAVVLQTALAPTNTKVELFKVDETLPPEMFAQLSRAGGGKKKGKGKKGKK